MTYEVELKIQLQNGEKQKLEEYLKFKSKFLGGFKQQDYYFDTLIPSFAQKDIALRVRIERNINDTNNLEFKNNSNYNENIIELTYKGKKINQNSKTRLEYNILLDSNTNFKTVENFFQELGYINAINIAKERMNYEIEEGIVLSLDKIFWKNENELGDFVEIEKIATDENQIVETEEYLWNKLQSMVGKLTKDRKIVKSYLELILEARATNS